MIEILLALQVNNWNEERKLRQKEDQIMIQLKDNLGYLLQEIETDAAYLQYNIEVADTVLFYDGIDQKNEVNIEITEVLNLETKDLLELLNKKMNYLSFSLPNLNIK